MHIGYVSARAQMRVIVCRSVLSCDRVLRGCLCAAAETLVLCTGIVFGVV